MKQFVNFLTRYLSTAPYSMTARMATEIDIETKMAGTWQGYIQLDGKDIQPIWFLLKADDTFEVFVSPFDSDPFRFTGIWEVNENYFSAVFNGRIDTWILEGKINEENDSIKGGIIIQGDLAEIVDSETSHGIFILKK